MNPTIETIKTRRSIRRFKSDMLPRETIDAIIEAGLYAPSGMNTQNTVIVAITNKELRDRLSRANAAVMGSDRDPFYGAPCIIVVLTDPNGNTPVEDGSCVLAHLLVAAESLGLGACWVHRAKQMFESEEGKALLKAWGLPETMIGIGNCILGYPAVTPTPKNRADNRIIKVD